MIAYLGQKASLWLSDKFDRVDKTVYFWNVILTPPGNNAQKRQIVPGGN